MASNDIYGTLNYTFCTIYCNGTVRVRLNLNQYGTYTYFSSEYNVSREMPIDVIMRDCKKRGMKVDYTIFNKVDFIIGDIYVIMINDIEPFRDIRFLDIVGNFEVSNSLIVNKLGDETKTFIKHFVPYVRKFYEPNLQLYEFGKYMMMYYC